MKLPEEKPLQCALCGNAGPSSVGAALGTLQMATADRQCSAPFPLLRTLQMALVREEPHKRERRQMARPEAQTTSGAKGKTSLEHDHMTGGTQTH